MVELFSAGGRKIAVALIVMFVTFSFGLIALAEALLLVKVKREVRNEHEGNLFLWTTRFIDCTVNQARHSNRPNRNSNRRL